MHPDHIKVATHYNLRGLKLEAVRASTLEALAFRHMGYKPNSPAMRTLAWTRRRAWGNLHMARQGLMPDYFPAPSTASHVIASVCRDFNGNHLAD